MKLDQWVLEVHLDHVENQVRLDSKGVLELLAQLALKAQEVSQDQEAHQAQEVNLDHRVKSAQQVPSEDLVPKEKLELLDKMELLVDKAQQDHKDHVVNPDPEENLEHLELEAHLELLVCSHSKLSRRCYVKTLRYLTSSVIIQCCYIYICHHS